MTRAETMAVLTGLLVTVAMAGGCASTGYQKAGKASDQMGDLKAELERGKVQIDATTAALNNLTKATDPQAAYKAYEKELKKTQDQAKRVDQRAHEMRKRGAEYFKQWEEQVAALGSDELRRRATERREELTAAFQKISEASEALDEAYEPFMADLVDIENYLSADLTPQSIQLISDLIEQAVQEAAVVNQRVDDVIKQIDDTVAKFGAGAPQS
jgi:methyl-accepting chemotaxis protein